MEGLSAIEEVELSSRCSIALAALGAQPSAGNLGLEVIRALKQKGYKIISYEESAESWPLGLQCQALLAGSLRLLDSAKADFAQELRRLLAQLLQAEAVKWGEEEKIRVVMKDLGLVGESQAMISVFQWILRVSALSDLPTLITGETGTGKELVAHAIYKLDPKRGNGPFVALNCGAISPGLAESELFGHRRGAFTGADRDRKGLIRSAEGGILFLDEIGELDDALQTKLLRALQENRVLGVGEDQEVSVNVRVIAASNRELEKMVQQRKFRADLFHRLNVLSTRIPPLRERPEDIKPLIEYFLQKYRSLNPAVSTSVRPDFVEALTQVELPGNARELENLVRQILVNKDDKSPLDLSDLPIEVWQQLSEQVRSPLVPSEQVSERKEMQTSMAKTLQHDIPSYLVNLLEANGWSLSQSLRYCERLLLEAALHAAHGNQSQTARLVGITPRSVYNKLRKHHLQV
ncbi:MAG: sigma-54-dependent Fis family transcriptional regulator [Deltaproteobacteria bacterium]|nr:sigma-54-dependent Fis family transcriptional regulator [Deltaproteobacteria bacterium]